MCPECITSLAMVAAGMSSAGGLGALVASTFRNKEIQARALGEPAENAVEPHSASFEEWIAAVLAWSREEQYQQSDLLKQEGEGA